MERATAASQRLIAGVSELGLAEPSLLKTREEARRFFLFVILSVLVEQRTNRNPSNDAVAEKIKEDFSLELLAAVKTLRSLTKAAQTPAEGPKL